MWQYKKKDGFYILVDESRNIRLNVGTEVAIGYSHAQKDARALMHKHGSPKQVEAWVNNARESYRRNGFEALAEEFAVIRGAFDVNDLNKVIDNVSYLGEFLKKQGIEPPQHLLRKVKEQAVAGASQAYP